MKKIKISFIIAMIAIMNQNLFAQNATEWVVFSQNKCHSEYLDDLSKSTEEKWAPVLNEVVAEGKWIRWGILQHAWGDEWNWNIYYVAENSAAFFEGWNLMINKMKEKYPDFMEETQKFCFEHKDNMYVQRFGSNMQ